MVKVDQLIRGIRRESQLALGLGTLMFLLVGAGNLISRFQGQATIEPNDRASIIGLTSLGFLGMAYGLLTARMAGIAEALAAEARAVPGSDTIGREAGAEGAD
ncbi:hypothetical protein EP7_002911 [Isosphaeraceae bacterium EP7]